MNGAVVDTAGPAQEGEVLLDWEGPIAREHRQRDIVLWREPTSAIRASLDVLRKDVYAVRTVPLVACQRIVAEHHYARGGSNTATFRHGLVHISDPLRCLGIAWWIPPTRSSAEASWDGDWRKVLTLSRLVILPGVPKNACSFLLARSVRLIRADGRFRCLVTYADTRQGHTGAIYRAANWEYLGLTSAEATFVDAKGRTIARKAGPVTRTHREMADLGYFYVGSFAKHKYRLILPEPRRRVPRGQLPLDVELVS